MESSHASNSKKGSLLSIIDGSALSTGHPGDGGWDVSTVTRKVSLGKVQKEPDREKIKLIADYLSSLGPVRAHPADANQGSSPLFGPPLTAAEELFQKLPIHGLFVPAMSSLESNQAPKSMCSARSQSPLNTVSHRNSGDRQSLDSKNPDSPPNSEASRLASQATAFKVAQNLMMTNYFRATLPSLARLDEKLQCANLSPNYTNLSFDAKAKSLPNFFASDGLRSGDAVIAQRRVEEALASGQEDGAEQFSFGEKRRNSEKPSTKLAADNARVQELFDDKSGAFAAGKYDSTSRYDVEPKPETPYDPASVAQLGSARLNGAEEGFNFLKKANPVEESSAAIMRCSFSNNAATPGVWAALNTECGQADHGRSTETQSQNHFSSNVTNATRNSLNSIGQHEFRGEVVGARSSDDLRDQAKSPSFSPQVSTPGDLPYNSAEEPQFANKPAAAILPFPPVHNCNILSAESILRSEQRSLDSESRKLRLAEIQLTEPISAFAFPNITTAMSEPVSEKKEAGEGVNESKVIEDARAPLLPQDSDRSSKRKIRLADVNHISSFGQGFSQQAGVVIGDRKWESARCSREEMQVEMTARPSSEHHSLQQLQSLESLNDSSHEADTKPSVSPPHKSPNLKLLETKNQNLCFFKKKDGEQVVRLYPELQPDLQAYTALQSAHPSLSSPKQKAIPYPNHIAKEAAGETPSGNKALSGSSPFGQGEPVNTKQTMNFVTARNQNVDSVRPPAQPSPVHNQAASPKNTLRKPGSLTPLLAPDDEPAASRPRKTDDLPTTQKKPTTPKAASRPHIELPQEKQTYAECCTKELLSSIKRSQLQMAGQDSTPAELRFLLDVSKKRIQILKNLSQNLNAQL